MIVVPAPNADRDRKTIEPELPDRDAVAGPARQRKIIHIDTHACFAPVEQRETHLSLEKTKKSVAPPTPTAGFRIIRNAVERLAGLGTARLTAWKIGPSVLTV